MKSAPSATSAIRLLSTVRTGAPTWCLHVAASVGVGQSMYDIVDHVRTDQPPRPSRAGNYNATEPRDRRYWETQTLEVILQPDLFPPQRVHTGWIALVFRKKAKRRYLCEGTTSGCASIAARCCPNQRPRSYGLPCSIAAVSPAVPTHAPRDAVARGWLSETRIRQSTPHASARLPAARNWESQLPVSFSSIG